MSMEECKRRSQSREIIKIGHGDGDIDDGTVDLFLFALNALFHYSAVAELLARWYNVTASRRWTARGGRKTASGPKIKVTLSDSDQEVDRSS